MQQTLALELATRIGQRIECALDDYLIEGVLSSVSGELMTVVQTTGYGSGTVTNVSIPAINFVRFPQAA